MLAKDAWVPLAEVARPHGVKGELRLKPFNRDSELLVSLDEVLLRTKDGEEHEVSIDAARWAGDAILMKLYSVDDRDKAAELRGALVCAQRGSFPELAAGEFYWCDLIGARVVVGAPGGSGASPDETGEERLLGTVRELQAYPSVDVLVVRAADGGADWEVPLLDTYVSGVDPAAELVRLATLEGLER